jgi:hypothetical protein
MSTPVIHLEEYYLEKVLVERLSNKELSASDTISLTFDYDYVIKRNRNKPNEFALTFIVKDNPSMVTPTPQAYKLDLQIIGLFRFETSVEEQQMQYLIRYNGCAILYGILRGMLTMLSGAFPEGAIRMPTIMIDEVVKKVEAKNQVKPPEASKRAKTTVRKLPIKPKK